jgi:urease accessory protein
MQTKTSYKVSFLLLSSILSGAANAHHVSDSMMPNSFAEGLLSGLAHPVIGLDHLAFIIGIGLLSFILKQQKLAPMVFVGGTMAGVVMHLNSIDIPMSEALVAMSLVLLGATLFIKHYKEGSNVKYLVIGFAGVLHGYAYGESIVGAEMSPIAAYLIGLAFIQVVIAYVASLGFKRLSQSEGILGVDFAKIYGVVVALTGTFFLVA